MKRLRISNSREVTQSWQSSLGVSCSLLQRSKDMIFNIRYSLYIVSTIPLQSMIVTELHEFRNLKKNVNMKKLYESSDEVDGLNAVQSKKKHGKHEKHKVASLFIFRL